jgi:hypothetical protein
MSNEVKENLKLKEESSKERKKIVKRIFQS